MEKEKRKVAYRPCETGSRSFQLLKPCSERVAGYHDRGARKTALGVFNAFENYEMVFEPRAEIEFQKYLEKRTEKKSLFERKGLEIGVVKANNINAF